MDDSETVRKIKFIKYARKPTSSACGRNGILIKQGFLGDGESPNNRLPASFINGTIIGKGEPDDEFTKRGAYQV